jgi:uncharacterized coiled-coil protein SlyX
MLMPLVWHFVFVGLVILLIGLILVGFVPFAIVEVKISTEQNKIARLNQDIAQTKIELNKVKAELNQSLDNLDNLQSGRSESSVQLGDSGFQVIKLGFLFGLWLSVGLLIWLFLTYFYVGLEVRQIQFYHQANRRFWQHDPIVGQTSLKLTHWHLFRGWVGVVTVMIWVVASSNQSQLIWIFVGVPIVVSFLTFVLFGYLTQEMTLRGSSLFRALGESVKLVTKNFIRNLILWSIPFGFLTMLAFFIYLIYFVFTPTLNPIVRLSGLVGLLVLIVLGWIVEVIWFRPWAYLVFLNLSQTKDLSGQN